MRKYLLLLALALPLPAFGQYVAVTAQVKDPNNFVYANCNYNVLFVGQSSNPGPYLISGSVFQQSFVGARCDASGNFSISLYPNAQISPTPSQWQFNICDQNNKTCFSVLVTITGPGTQNISTQINAAAPLLPVTSLTLKTNGTTNGSQTLLNLVNGSGTTITQDGAGNVTINSTGGGGGGGSCAGCVTAVNASAPLNSSGGVTPTITIVQADSGHNGFLTSGDWTTFNGKQAALGFTPENVANKNATNGYPGLVSGLIAPAQLGTGASITTKFLRGDSTWQTLPATGLADPGANGIVTRTALNTTSVATFTDVTNLWSGSATSANFLRGDGSLQPAVTGSGTTNTIPLLVASNVLGNSDWTDNPGVSVTAGVPVLITGTWRIDSAFAGSNNAAASTAMSAMFFNSSTGKPQVSINAASPVNMITTNDFNLVQNCGTTTTCSHTVLTTPQIVIGSVALAGGTATITGFSPAFTSNTSYHCSADDTTSSVSAAQVVKVSGSSITLNGSGTDVIDYICVGN